MRPRQSKILRNVADLRFYPERLVFTNGCFDLLHCGHIQLLETASTLGRLVVGVNSDASIRQLKGPKRPVMPQAQRLEVIAALEAVDFCFIFDSVRCDQILRQLHPAYWVKGGDYTVDSLDAGERAAAAEVGAAIRIIPSVPDLSTTSILARSQQ